MNGIMPGPLFLAIASASNADSSLNGTLTDVSKRNTVAGKIPGGEKSITNGELNGRGDVDGELYSTEHTTERMESCHG